ncbi:MAG: hypothetical protein FWG60_04220 [Methanomassiliicoccaceae archaeon]|nr:hypothetical protein [Methanomassiliicoccaceae archaeon]
MEVLGVVYGIADNGVAIVIGTDDVPDIGNPVFDSEKKRIGTVKRVFGPVGEPFITVGIDDTAALKGIMGKKLFTARGTRNGKDKRRYRRD